MADEDTGSRRLHTPDGIPIGGWVLRVDPARFDVGPMLEEFGQVFRYPLDGSPRSDLMRSGQPCFLWQSDRSKVVGIWAVGEVVAPTYSAPVDPDDPSSLAQVFAEVELFPLVKPIADTKLRQDKVLAGSELLTDPNQADPVVLRPEEVRALEEFDFTITEPTDDQMARLDEVLGDHEPDDPDRADVDAWEQEWEGGTVADIAAAAPTDPLVAPVDPVGRSGEFDEFDLDDFDEFGAGDDDEDDVPGVLFQLVGTDRSLGIRLDGDPDGLFSVFTITEEGAFELGRFAGFADALSLVALRSPELTLPDPVPAAEGQDLPDGNPIAILQTEDGILAIYRTGDDAFDLYDPEPDSAGDDEDEGNGNGNGNDDEIDLDADWERDDWDLEGPLLLGRFERLEQVLAALADSVEDDDPLRGDVLDLTDHTDVTDLTDTGTEDGNHDDDT